MNKTHAINKAALKALVTSAAGLFLLGTVQAASIVDNRNDVFDAIKQLKTSSTISDLNVWINEKSEQPVITIGDSIRIKMSSATPAHYTLWYVDSKGNTSILRPQGVDDGSNTFLEYPPKSGEHVLTQVEPIGEDTLFLLATKLPIPSELLGMADQERYRNLGKDMAQLQRVIRSLNVHQLENPLSIARYSYMVDSTSTQYTTRSISRNVNQAEVEEVVIDFNNVNFEYKSVALTPNSQSELDGLGSALVNVEKKHGNFPMVELIGHTDSIASQNYNFKLSKRRAEAAKKYLEIEFGIPSNVISTVGAGETKPIADNETENGRALNRRVELRIQLIQ